MKHTAKRIVTLLSLAVLLTSVIIPSIPVYAEDAATTIGTDCKIPDKTTTPEGCWDDYFGSNDIIYYDPNAELCNTGDMTLPGAVTPTEIDSGPLSGNSNAEKAWIYLGNKGLTAEQIAGILGNFQAESGMDPAIIQGGAIAGAGYAPVNGVGFGIAQWTFTSRQAPLVALANSTGRQITDLSVQLDYLWQELNSTHAHALASLKGATTPEQAAYVFHRDYEGSADSEAQVIANRGGGARLMYEQFKNLSSTAEGTGTSDSGAATVINSTSMGPGSAFALTCEANKAKAEATATNGAGVALPADYMSDSFTLFTQCGNQLLGGSWGNKKTPQGDTICKAGSIPTALAVIAKNVAERNVTPADTVDYYTKNNMWANTGGSFLNSPVKAASDFGLRAIPITDKGDIAAYKKVFKAGGVIMTISTGSAPFTTNRHPIIIRGITDEGRFMIADPGQTDTNIEPLNQPTTEKILTDVRSDEGSVSYAFYKK
ncbi:MAG TPA: phage tail tip lysozyme [Candidatus Saccharimonadales bacterium]